MVLTKIHRTQAFTVSKCTWPKIQVQSYD